MIRCVQSDADALNDVVMGTLVFSGEHQFRLAEQRYEPEFPKQQDHCGVGRSAESRLL